jgi:pimeloyl-ACP methyl ester carboxylesterase
MSHEMTTGGSRIAVYEAEGSGDGTRVFAVGGLAGRSVTDSPLGEALAEAAQAGARCTMVDIAWTGNSKRYTNPLSMELWLADVEFVFRKHVGQDAIWVGASIGAWLMLLLHKRHPAWFRAMCALAPAIDWDVQYLLPGIESRKLVMQDRFVVADGTQVVPSTLVTSMPRNRVLDRPLEIAAPLHIIQGGADEMASAAFSKQLSEHATGTPVTFELLDGDDHGVAKLASARSRDRFKAWLLPQLARPQRPLAMTTSTLLLALALASGFTFDALA